MRTYAALIAYDGTEYHGFQRQVETQPTVQSTVENALSRLARQPVTVLGSGRTDSGVHAVGQVITFSLAWQHHDEDLHRALNANLPEDIAILQLKQVPSSFHPRYDAQRRTYEYTIYNDPIRNPIKRNFSWHVYKYLDEEKMNQAAKSLLGTHNFATFGQPPQGNNYVRELFLAKWTRSGSDLTFRVEANAFLYRMVRSIVGSLKLVGDGTWTIKEFVRAFKAENRHECGTVAPPQGLCLVSITYKNLSWLD
ncbi:tRNA pseudouridine(38-40) synthase TruA [Candidatus Leptofilum sp.]|uniref:tRNA pseudouridine(38-40) synthase TruA n=1 Tax=Candidatus Leptofilum sp. TaxID=3241576 RepID=UPI003B5A1A4E